MKGTLISILVGALAGVLLTVGSNVRAAHVAASRERHESIELIAPARVEPRAASDSEAVRARPGEPSPVQP